jgi:glutaconate CoA-transferase subunit B
MIDAGWTGVEAMTVAMSRVFEDHRVVFAGVGVPLLASVLAQQLHAPDLTVVLEGGIVDPHMAPGLLPISTNEMRAAHGARMLTGIIDVFHYAQRGAFDYGVIGAAQVDRYGNVNTSVIGDYDAPTVRLPGSGGANDIVSSCRDIYIVTKHEPRRFVERVDFITSPGFLDGGHSREEAGLRSARPVAVITDLAWLGFDPDSRRMTVEALQPGVSLDEVRAATGFELLVPSGGVPTLAPPTDEELHVLRSLEHPAADPPAAPTERASIG